MAAKYDIGGKYAVENSFATLLYAAFCRLRTPDDTSLRSTDEVYDIVSLNCLRELSLDLCKSVREILAAVIDDIVHILDCIDLV